MAEAGPELLWEPTAEAVDANLARYLARLRSERGVSLSDYAALWEWLVERLGPFWESIWDFYGVRASTPYDVSLGDSSMPGTRWFAGAKLNYAEHVLGRATPERPALIARSERHERLEVSWKDLVGQVGAIASALLDAGVGPRACARRQHRSSTINRGGVRMAIRAQLSPRHVPDDILAGLQFRAG